MKRTSDITDEEFGQYHRLVNAIGELLGKSIPFQTAMNLLHLIHGGRMTPFVGNLRGKFTQTMPVIIGGTDSADLMNQVKMKHQLDSYAESMMRHKHFVTLAESEVSVQIVLSPEDQGFTKQPTWSEFSNAGRLAEWSRVNFDGYAVELNPAEVGPQMAIQYMNQPKGDILWVAMQAVSDLRGHLRIFGVGRGGGDSFWLYSDYFRSSTLIALDRRFVFRLRKLD